ncbi:MAG: salicylate hydroxylase, partial [Saprospiraceae bacterium]
FDDRSQGYGLTLQQASKAIQGFGIFSLPSGVISTRHVVHTTDGKIVGEWGKRKWSESKENTSSGDRKRTNIHVARQSLRLELFKRLNGNKYVQWGHQLVDIKQKPVTNNDVTDQPLGLTFQVNGKKKDIKADLVIGADGIRSTVRNLLIGEQNTPLNYLGCIVILGICKLSDLKNQDNILLDSATVFQTANGNERIYMMPYSSEAIMWQLSFPMSEKNALLLSKKGVKELKKEAIRRTPWHDPVPQIVEATLNEQISGYPVYDRELLSSEELQKNSQATLIGDAAHPMSPFKGQGANQALLDALVLARLITKECRPLSDWKKSGIRKSVLTEFESEMLARSASKVKDSAEAAQFLHSDIVLHEADKPRGKNL